MSDADLIIYIFTFLFGISFGSFANVLIYRWPKEESVLGGRSFCGSCGEVIPWYNNIPVLSYFFLKGKCANCGRKFSIQYPIVEFITGVLFVWVVSVFGVTWTALEMLILVYGLLVGSFIDWEHMILPDEITVGGMFIGLIGAALNPDRQFLDAFLGVLFGG